MLENRKKLEKINLEAVGLPKETDKIYVSVHLTPHNANIAYHCRQLRKSKKILKLSTRKGIIKVLVPNDEFDIQSKWEVIHDINDLLKLFPDLSF